MRRAPATVLLAALLAVGCAHAPAAPPAPARPHAEVRLMEVKAELKDDQRQALESVICGGLTEGNHGDVTCPESLATSLSLLRQRAQLTGSGGAEVDAVLARVDQIPQRVLAQVEPRADQLHLTLTLSQSKDGATLAQRQLDAASFDDLLLKASDEAKALLR